MTALICYSTTDGHTKKIAETMANDWQGEVKVIPFHELDQYVGDRSITAVVVGASIRYGHFNKQLVASIRAKLDWFESIQTAFYSVNLTARKPGKDDPATSPYVTKFLKTTGWKPDQIAMFAGRLAYPMYRFWDKQMIRFIMKLTGGCADGKSTVEYTNWSEVRRFSKTVSGLAAS